MDEKKFCSVMENALTLEEEGIEFYGKCGEKTTDKEGKAMFSYLAKEEVGHYNRVAEIFRIHLSSGYCDYIAAKKDRKPSGIFEKNISGGSLHDKSDILDALNIGLRAEENSIKLYKSLAEEAEDEDVKAAFQQLVSEEEKHRSMIENEIRHVTETGDFHDFRIVTS
jgi:rubrerythrin